MQPDYPRIQALPTYCSWSGGLDLQAIFNYLYSHLSSSQRRLSRCYQPTDRYLDGPRSKQLHGFTIDNIHDHTDLQEAKAVRAQTIIDMQQDFFWSWRIGILYTPKSYQHISHDHRAESVLHSPSTQFQAYSNPVKEIRYRTCHHQANRSVSQVQLPPKTTVPTRLPFPSI